MTTITPKPRRSKRRAPFVRLKRLPRLRLGRNAPTIALMIGCLAAVELYSAGVITQFNREAFTLAGVLIQSHLVEIAITFGCSILSVVVAATATDMRFDPRPEQKARSGAAAALSLALLLIPMSYLAQAFAYPRQVAEWKAYTGSDAMAADKAIVDDPMTDSRERAEAAQRLTQAAKPAKAAPNAGDWLKAALLHLSIWLCGTIGLKAKPETEAQRKRREANERREREMQEAERLARIERQRDPWWPLSAIAGALKPRKVDA